jgi:hypothetical protein
MSQLLQLRARAKKLDPLSRSLDRLLQFPVMKENLTMALFSCRYQEYHEWRLSVLRQRFPGHSYGGTADFLTQYLGYMDYAKEWSLTLKMLEKHFYFVCPEEYVSLEIVAKTLFFEEYVDMHIARLLLQTGDDLLEFRRHPNMTSLFPVMDLLLLLFTWYRLENQEMWLLRLWKTTFFLFYRNQRDPNLFFSDMAVAEKVLQREYDLCSLLPQTTSFYTDILEDVTGRCTFIPLLPEVLDFRHVLRGLVMYRPSFLEEWEGMVSARWEKNPWEAVTLFAKFVEECDVTGNGVRKAVIQSFQRQVRLHATVLARTLYENRNRLLLFLFQYGGESLDEVVNALVLHVWNRRHDGKALREARNLLGKIRGANERVSWSLSSLVHDLSESLLYHGPRFRTYLCRNIFVGSLPADEIECAETRVFKEEFLKTYRETYPFRKLQWLDWQSSVELVGGATMSLVHLMVLRVVEKQGPVRIGDLCTRLGWASVYVRGIVHSLVFHKHQPLLDRCVRCVVGEKNNTNAIKDSDVVSLRETDIKNTRGADYALPQFLAEKVLPLSASSSSLDEILFLEAFVVRSLKKGGSFSLHDLLETVNENPRTSVVSSARLQQVLENLIKKEYARCDEHGHYQYVP